MGYMSCFERVAMQATMSRDQTLLTNTHQCSFGISHCIFTANGLRNG